MIITLPSAVAPGVAMRLVQASAEAIALAAAIEVIMSRCNIATQR